MSDPFLSEIRLVGFNFAPNGWALCNGQLLSISSNTALFSLLGTTYGGNGTSTFGLPNLQGAAALGRGQGPGLSDYTQGEQTGSATQTLLASQMPAHSHRLLGAHAPQSRNTVGGTLADGGYYADAAPDTPMAPEALAIAGAGAPVGVMQPSLVASYIIALQGIYPPRS